jgi:hypothetical protein
MECLGHLVLHEVGREAQAILTKDCCVDYWMRISYGKELDRSKIGRLKTDQACS